MKYYLYISDAKLDMLYAQIPAERRKFLVSELKLDLKIVSMSLRENPGADETRYSKLQLVADYLDRTGDVGSVDEPATYFRGELSMKWGPLGKDFEQRPSAVYFTGHTQRTIVGLGGSRHHVIGALRGDDGFGFEYPNSAVSAVMDAVVAESSYEQEGQAIATMKFAYEDLWPSFVMKLEEEYQAPTQHVEFLARRLAEAPPGSAARTRKAILLASPIYVAAVD